ncbi:MAG: hypothetical protein R2861_07235 [Desulfobacterales bacterium]
MQRSETLKSSNNFIKRFWRKALKGHPFAKVAKRMKIHPSLILHYFGSRKVTLALVDYVIEAYGRIVNKELQI